MTLTDFTRYPTGNLCNASPVVQALPSALRPLIPGVRIAGRARTARITPGQNAAIHYAVRDAAPGDLLVVDGGASARYGAFGDLLAEGCQQRQMAGAVLDCTIRDKADITALGFQVFSRGFHPEGTTKSEPGEYNVPVTLGGVVVWPGDIVVGDDDGVVIIPSDAAAAVLAAVVQVAAREAEIRKRIQAGESTSKIFGLD